MRDNPNEVIAFKDGKDYYCLPCYNDGDDELHSVAKPIERRDLEYELDGRNPHCISCCEEIK